jgi:hypothetical protein
MLLTPDLRDWIPGHGRELYKLRKKTVEPVFGIII